MGGISFWQLLIIVLVVVVLFGGSRVRNLGGDLGKSLKDFKREMSSKDDEAKKTTVEKAAEPAAQPAPAASEPVQKAAQEPENK